MTVSSESKARLVELIKELSVIHGPVTLSSGIQANYYVDLRRATLHHEAAPLIGKVMLELLDNAGLKDYDSVGGLTMGADPVATAILHQASAQGRTIDAFVVRKAPKDHGMGKQVEHGARCQFENALCIAGQAGVWGGTIGHGAHGSGPVAQSGGSRTPIKPTALCPT